MEPNLIVGRFWPPAGLEHSNAGHIIIYLLYDAVPYGWSNRANFKMVAVSRDDIYICFFNPKSLSFES